MIDTITQDLSCWFAAGDDTTRDAPFTIRAVKRPVVLDVKAEVALEALAEAGYAVRHLPSQGLPDALRITIGKSEDMAKVTATLRALCGETA